MFSGILLKSLLVSVASACLTPHLHNDMNDDHVQANHQRRSAKPPPKVKIGLKNVQVFDGNCFQPRLLAIAGDRITFDVKKVETWVDGKGGFLIPGLIDSHCHPESIADLDQLSSYGVTTAMGMSCPDFALCQSLRNQPGLTSFFTANHGVVGPNSTHAIVFQSPPSLQVRSPAQAPELVDWAIGNHSDYFKICAEPNGPSQESQNAIVALAHKRGLPTTTHAADIPSYLEAVASLTDGIQHSAGDGFLTQDMIKHMKKNRQYVTPTTVLVQAFMRYPEALALSTYTAESWAFVVENLKRMYRAGIPLLVGTDAIPSQGPLAALVQHPLGATVHSELEVFVKEAGIPALDALRAATSVPARIHGLKDRGQIAEGKRADLVLLGANPLKNISATRNILRVWNGGIEYKDIATH